jgi:hypothetical protein
MEGGKESAMLLLQLFVGIAATVTTAAPASGDLRVDAFSVRPVTIASPGKPALPFGLAFPTKRVVRTWRMRPAPPVSVHRDDEQGPVIRTERGILHCEGHRFHADNAYEVDPESHREDPAR